MDGGKRLVRRDELNFFRDAVDVGVSVMTRNDWGLARKNGVIRLID